MIGFGLITLAVVTATVIAYFSISRLMETVDDLSKPNEMVAKIDTILVTIAETENILQEYAISKKISSLEGYHGLVAELDSQIDRLQAEAQGDSVQRAKLDSISNLLNQKLINFDAFLQLSRQRSQFDFYQKALKKLDIENQERIAPATEGEVLQKIQRQPPVANLSKVNKDTTTQQQQAKDTTTQQTEERIADNNESEKPEKNNSVLGFLGGLFSKKKDKPDTVAEQSANKDVEKALSALQDEQLKLQKRLNELQKNSGAGIRTDSIKRILAGVKLEQRNIQRKLDDRELSFMSKNAEVMRKIHRLVNDIEKHQEMLEDTSSELVKFTLQNSVRNIAIILILAFTSTGIFIYLIFTDIARSDYYKKELLTAKNKAEDLAKVKENFLANMSHEIRTPLTAILGFTEQLVKSAELKKREKEYLNAIDNSSGHLLALVNDILDLSKMEADQVKLENEGFDIISVIAQIYSNLKYQADKKGLTFNYKTSGNELHLVKGDAFRLKQILFNLVSNAIKFTEKGEVNLLCDLAVTDLGRVKATITIQDSGIGIPAERIDTIFENFNQADVSTTRKFGGTGLGLAISKKLAQLQGGHIDVKSEPGKGSAFTIEIDYDKAHSSDLQLDQAETITYSDEFAGRSVLVIDDDTLNTRLTEIVLDKWELQTTIVHRGKEALEITENQQFDLILSDLQMPEMSGEQIAEAIRKSENGSNNSTPIIAFTANIYRKEWSHYEAAGITDYLLKPFSEANLHQILKKYVKPAAGTNDRPNSKGNKKEAVAATNTPEPQIIAGPMANKPLYTLKTIKMFTGNDVESLANFLEEFIQTNQYSLDKLKHAVERNDAEQVSFHAHKMLPNLQNLEAHHLTNVLRELELITPATYNKNTGQQVLEVIENTEVLLEALSDEMDFIKQQT